MKDTTNMKMKQLIKFTTLARLLPATSALAQRVAFPLLFLGAGLVLVQPSMVPGSARNWDCPPHAGRFNNPI
jgi:hypothetical protein